VIYRRSPKRWALNAKPDKRGLVLTTAPELPGDEENLESITFPLPGLPADLLDGPPDPEDV
jgi:hypothetical protein